LPDWVWDYEEERYVSEWDDDEGRERGDLRRVGEIG